MWHRIKVTCTAYGAVLVLQTRTWTGHQFISNDLSNMRIALAGSQTSNLINPEYSLEGLMLKLKLWPPDAKSQPIGKDPDAGKDWGQEKKGTTEDEMVGWHHQLSRHEFEQTLGDSKGQGSLVWHSHWGPKELDTTEWLTHTHTHIPT